MAPQRHTALEPVAWLLGTWRGRGKVFYPTIDDFTYEEECFFSHNGKPFLIYSQRTWDPGTGAPRHSETGYWRPAGPARVEIVLAHPTGQTEVSEGTIDGTSIDVHSTSIGATATAKDVTALSRVYELSNERLSYTLAMAAVGEPLTGHLRATLERAR